MLLGDSYCPACAAAALAPAAAVVAADAAASPIEVDSHIILLGNICSDLVN